jgi:hypothetical protein
VFVWLQGQTIEALNVNEGKRFGFISGFDCLSMKLDSYNLKLASPTSIEAQSASTNRKVNTHPTRQHDKMMQALWALNVDVFHKPAALSMFPKLGVPRPVT